MPAPAADVALIDELTRSLRDERRRAPGDLLAIFAIRHRRRLRALEDVLRQRPAV